MPNQTPSGRDADQTSSSRNSASDTVQGQQGERRNEVSPGPLNLGDRGAADMPPTTSEQLNFEDASEERPRGDTRRTGGTWDTPTHNTGDQGAVGPAPKAGLSDRIGPSDPDPDPDR